MTMEPANVDPFITELWKRNVEEQKMETLETQPPRKILMQSKHQNLGWTSGRVSIFRPDSGIYRLLVLTPEEEKHSIAPISVTLEFEDGFQHKYTLHQETCEACGQVLPVTKKEDSGT